MFGMDSIRVLGIDDIVKINQIIDFGFWSFGRQWGVVGVDFD